MNKKQINCYVTAAFKALQTSRMIENGVVDRAMVGKVASFGPTVISMGLKPAVALFSKTTGGADRVPVAEAIFQTLKKAESRLVDGKNNLLDCVKDLDGSELHRAKREILDVSVAVKPALRTYPEKKPESR